MWNWQEIKRVLCLSFSLAKANFKVRNEGSYLGIFWYSLEPLALFVIFLILGGVINIDIEHYPLYLFLGLIMFNLFSKATTEAASSISDNAAFIKSTKIPYEALVISRVFQFVFSHIFELVIFVVFMIIFNVNFFWIISYSFIFIIFFFFVLGLAFFLAVIGVYVRDLHNIWRIVIILLMFLTPIFYFSKEGFLIAKINLFNPLYYFISIARDFVIYHKGLELGFFIGAILFSVFSFFLGLFIFRRYKYKFAEML